MNKILLILACIFTALCWLSLCLDWDITMYLSGIIALILIGFSDIKKMSSIDKRKEKEI